MSIYTELTKQGIEDKIAKHSEKVALSIVNSKNGGFPPEIVKDLRYDLGLLPIEIPAMVTHSIRILEDYGFVYLGKNGRYSLSEEGIKAKDEG